MRVLLAPQEFKGSLTATEAAAAMAEGVRRALPVSEVDLAPMADGGPGTLDAIVAARQGEVRTTRVSDPLGRDVEARWGYLTGGEAVIEMAEAAGLLRLRPEERDATRTTTFGVGQLIRAALYAGCRRFVIGIGGSATNDGGAGMAQALGARLLDAAGMELPPGGLALARLAAIDMAGFDRRVQQSRFEVAVDVKNPLVGPEGASAVYGPQKGASPSQVLTLDAALDRYAQVVETDLRVAIAGLPGGGAGGGLAAGLVAFCAASLQPGAALVARTIRLHERVRRADLVLTGEGSLDGQTLYGKTVLEVVRAARAGGVPAVAMAGQLSGAWQTLYDEGLTAAVSILPGPIGLDEAQARAATLVATTAEQIVRLVALARRSDWFSHRGERPDEQRSAE